MAQLILPPQALPTNQTLPQLFLAGSIDMGKAENWQAQVIQYFESEALILLNPRREDWNPDWKQSIENPEFKAQVEWELAAMAQADQILMYFASASLAPITLLELGLMASSGKLTVVCAPEFWRRGNIEVICEHYNLPLYTELESTLGLLKSVLLGRQRNQLC